MTSQTTELFMHTPLQNGIMDKLYEEFTKFPDGFVPVLDSIYVNLDDLLNFYGHKFSKNRSERVKKKLLGGINDDISR